MRKLNFFLFALASFFPFVSACGAEHEEIVGDTLMGFNLIGGGIVGGLIQILIIVVLGLMIALVIKNINTKEVK